MARDDASRAIGKIVSVSADRLIVELHRGSDNFTIVGFDDIHYVATLGSYLMVPMQAEHIVLEIIGLREKDSASSDASQTEMDKASSAKFLDVVPVGSMPMQGGSFRFGVSTFPPLYADALYARDEDLDRIFNVEQPSELETKKDAGGTDQQGNVPYTIEIGTSAVFKGYPVKSRLDELFGGHVAVLGNTGSGKSCTVASIFQSVFMKPEAFAALGSAFVIFDVNGEYRRALDNVPGWIRSCYLKATEPDMPIPDVSQKRQGAEIKDRFKLPHWFMSVDEWALLLRASEKSQIPALRTALGLTTLFQETPAQVANLGGDTDESLKIIRNHVLAKIILSILHSDASTPSKADRILALLNTFSTNEISKNTVSQGLYNDFGQFKDGKNSNTSNNYDNLLIFLEGHVKDEPVLPSYGNMPFSFDRLQAALDLALFYEEANGNKQIREYCSQLVTRLKSVIDNPDYEFLRADVGDLQDHDREPTHYVDRLLGIAVQNERYKKERQICIIDLNDASDEIVELASAVVARLIFDRMRRADPRNAMPVHLLLEEAHRYISEKPSRFAIDAGITFQRIAKEGRKYGAFLIVASQRPSELSKTVLSQCNNFIIHRIQNPDDLSQIRQMTPFISETVLRRLPSLPKQHALIFGNSVNIPTTFRVRDANPTPYSNDTQVRDIWYVPADPDVCWKP
ncbi:MAG: ATPase [Halioglobus sp.]|nr:ATPase [Halioglobus sp.]|tara:strand:+ start:5017 stop:7068 length:2052 start_codon:yes stop_codon:yes gene_type:complete